MRKNGNWGVADARVIQEVEKPNAPNSIVRVRVMWTADGKRFVDIRNWFNNQGQEGFPNMGKGIWIPMDRDVLTQVRNALDDIINDYTS